MAGRTEPHGEIGQVGDARDVMLFEDRLVDFDEASGILLATERAGRVLGHPVPTLGRSCGIADGIVTHNGSASFLVGFVLKLTGSLEFLKNLRSDLKLATGDLDTPELV